MIGDVLHLLRSDLVARGVTVQTALADGLPDVPGDAVQLQQVLLNIVTNACDAMAENPQKDRILKVSTSVQSGKVCVSMQDQGRGLGESDASQIFQPFFTTKSHGLGIGYPFASRSSLLTMEDFGRSLTKDAESPFTWNSKPSRRLLHEHPHAHRLSVG